MSYTATQVQVAMENFKDKDDFDGWGRNLYEYIKGEGHYSRSEEPFSVDVADLGKVTYVDDYGGEGQGDEYWVVFKVGDQFFRVDGWYASYDGGELDGDVYEVEPQEVTVIEYNRKK